MATPNRLTFHNLLAFLDGGDGYHCSAVHAVPEVVSLIEAKWRKEDFSSIEIYRDGIVIQ